MFLTLFGQLSFGQIVLFGLNIQGGAHSDGQVYQLCEYGGVWTYDDLYDFPASTNSASYEADATLCLASNNVLYGVSYNGGTNWNGEIFSYNPLASTYTDLYSVASNYDAQTNPVIQLVSGGSLFGMEEGGGTSFNGSVYKYNYHTNTYTTLHNFAGKPTDGAAPIETPLLWYRDTLYGVTTDGGSQLATCGFGGCCTCGYGTLFSMDSTGAVYKILYNFPPVGSANVGSEPNGSMVEAKNGSGNPSLYGVCYYGGANTSKGCIWQYDLVTYTYSDIYDFQGSGASDGTEPEGGLCLGNDGNLYGTTSLGGNNASNGFGTGDGILFKISPTTHVYTIVHTFAGGTTDGIFGANGIIKAPDGNLYGTLYQGGTSGGGIAYQYNTTTSTYSVIYNFPTSTTIGRAPIYNAFAAASNALCSPLPITLISFTGEYDASTNCSNLHWSTATEVDNRYFYIERSTDGQNWDMIETVAGAGNSDQRRYYTIADHNPPAGTVYYKLIQQDYDGKRQSFNIVPVTVPVSKTVSIYPNPATNFVTVDGNDLQNVTIYNMLGQIVWNQNTNGSKISVNVTSFANGVYIVQALDKSGNTTVLKFSKQGAGIGQ